MSASLVGSEMCIRDRLLTSLTAVSSLISPLATTGWVASSATLLTSSFRVLASRSVERGMSAGFAGSSSRSP
eukprot:14906474-Alexandrium_andersonii.AAC.1